MVDTPTVHIELLPGGILPSYQTEGAAGMDLHANNEEPIHIGPGGRVLVPTGLKIEIPEGYEGQVRPRSGLATRLGLTVGNAPGTIDSDFRGELKVLLLNLGSEPVLITRGERIAQLVIASYSRAQLVAKPLTTTARGDGGFGSTGV